MTPISHATVKLVNQLKAELEAKRPISNYDPEVWITQYKYSLGRVVMVEECPLHVAAKHRQLHQVPLNILEGNILNPRIVGGDMKTTLLHLAAEYGNIDQIPKHLITHDNLLFPDHFGATAIHAAVRLGYAGQIPEHIWTEKLLNATDELGKKVLEWLKDTDQIDCLIGAGIPQHTTNDFGDEWNRKHQQILAGRKALAPTIPPSNLDIF